MRMKGMNYEENCKSRGFAQLMVFMRSVFSCRISPGVNTYHRGRALITTYERNPLKRPFLKIGKRFYSG